MTAPRWMTVLGAALVVSLALNVFFFGVIVGHRVGRGGPEEITPAGMKLRLDRVLKVLPDDDAKVMRSLFEAQRGDIAERFRALQESRKAVGGTLKAEPFDPAAFTQAYETMQARSRELQDAIHAVIKAAIPQLSAEGRAAIRERRWRT
jgi:uncharacterized membrane protein